VRGVSVVFGCSSTLEVLGALVSAGLVLVGCFVVVVAIGPFVVASCRRAVATIRYGATFVRYYFHCR